VFSISTTLLSTRPSPRPGWYQRFDQTHAVRNQIQTAIPHCSTRITPILRPYYPQIPAFNKGKARNARVCTAWPARILAGPASLAFPLPLHHGALRFTGDSRHFSKLIYHNSTPSGIFGKRSYGPCQEIVRSGGESGGLVFTGRGMRFELDLRFTRIITWGMKIATRSRSRLGSGTVTTGVERLLALAAES